MRGGTRHLVVVSVVAALGLAGTLTAFADWSIPGTVTVKARAVKMPRGVNPSVAKQSKTAVVSWSSQELVPDVLMEQYVVTAHSADEPPLPDVAHTVSAAGSSTEFVTFAADEVAGGKWYWTIIPKFRQWAGAESGKSQKLNFPGVPATPEARKAPTLTVAADAVVVDAVPTPDASSEPPTVSPAPAETTDKADLAPPPPAEEPTPPPPTQTTPPVEAPVSSQPVAPDLPD
jgi:hypothetical protein